MMLERKINVAVIMGGISSEHDISIKSGLNVCSALNRNKFNIKPVKISRDGIWQLGSGYLERDQELENYISYIMEVDAVKGLSLLQDDEVDVVFIALHGPGGEDGVIQGFFETAGFAYTGSGVLGNAIGMDKILSKMVMEQDGIKTPPYVRSECDSILSDPDSFIEQIESYLGYPAVAKISNQGSSHNIGIAKNKQELREMLLQFAQNGEEILVEKFIKGREVTCAVIDKIGVGCSITLPPTELVPLNSDWFDFHAKYTAGATDEITPARIGDELTLKVQALAARCHSLLHCSGMSRTDMMIAEDDSIYVIEINTIPGLTHTSLIPQAAEVSGVSFSELLEIQVMWALEKRRKLQ